MLLDYYNQFLDKTALKLNATDNTLHGDVVDLGSAPTLQDIGAGQPVYLNIEFTTAVTSNGAATVTFTLLSDSTANLATSATTHITTPAYAIADMTAGKKYSFLLPQGNYERYLGIFASIGTQTLNAGNASIGLSLGAPKHVALPDALSGIQAYTPYN